MGFNSAFKGLISYIYYINGCVLERCVAVILEEDVASSELCWTDGCRDWIFLSFSRRI